MQLTRVLARSRSVSKSIAPTGFMVSMIEDLSVLKRNE